MVESKYRFCVKKISAKKVSRQFPRVLFGKYYLGRYESIERAG
jgi:hypothetical protein